MVKIFGCNGSDDAKWRENDWPIDGREFTAVVSQPF